MVCVSQLNGHSRNSHTVSCSVANPEIFQTLATKWVWINTYENTIFNGMNIHKSQLFWGSLGTRVLTHPQIIVSYKRHSAAAVFEMGSRSQRENRETVFECQFWHQGETWGPTLDNHPNWEVKVMVNS